MPISSSTYFATFKIKFILYSFPLLIRFQFEFKVHDWKTNTSFRDQHKRPPYFWWLWWASILCYLSTQHPAVLQAIKTVLCLCEILNKSTDVIGTTVCSILSKASKFSQQNHTLRFPSMKEGFQINNIYKILNADWLLLQVVIVICNSCLFLRKRRRLGLS